MQKNVVDNILTDFSHVSEKKNAVDTLFQYLYFNLTEFGVYYADEDVRSDFLLWLYPKLAAIIDKYDPTLSVFTTYLTMSIKFHWKVFGRKNLQQAAYMTIAHNEQQQIAEYMQEERYSVQCYDLYAASPQPNYHPLIEKGPSIKVSKRKESKKQQLYKRQLLLLACKSCFLIEDPMLEHLAESLELPTETLQSIITQAQKQAETRNTTYTRLAARRDFYYTRYKSAALQLSVIDETHTSVWERLKTQQAYNYTLWQRYLKRTKNYLRAPSNRALAKQFGISHGTVDNNLAAVKKACYGEP